MPACVSADGGHFALMKWTESCLIWHNFIKVAVNWIKICSLSHIWTCNRHVTFSQKIPNHLGKNARKPRGGGLLFWLTLYSLQQPRLKNAELTEQLGLERVMLVIRKVNSEITNKWGNHGAKSRRNQLTCKTAIRTESMSLLLSSSYVKYSLTFLFSKTFLSFRYSALIQSNNFRKMGAGLLVATCKQTTYGYLETLKSLWHIEYCMHILLHRDVELLKHLCLSRNASML